MRRIMYILIVCLLSVSVANASYTEGFVDLDNLQALAGDWLQPDGSDMDDFWVLAQVWYTDQSILPTPDHHWPLEETSGTEVNDIIAYEKLTDVEGTGFSIADASIVGRIDNGLRFDGGNDERIAHPTLLDDLDVTDSITIMMWARPMSDNLTTGGGLFQKQNVTPADSLQILAPKGSTYRAYIRNNANDGGGSSQTTLNSGVAVEVDVWRHVAFVWTPTDAYLYIDGQREAAAAEGTMGPGTYADMTIGTSNLWLNPFGGTIDDFRIYNTALNAAQIANIYAAFAPVTMYTLTVTDGAGGSGATGGGTFLNEVVVPITAGTPNPGYSFAGWTGDTAYVADTGSPSTTVTMPAANITVTATYAIQATNPLVVNNGTGDGDYPEGTTVPITADPADYNDIFVGWTGDTEYLADPNAASTTVSMPAVAVTVTATYDNRTNLLSMHWPMEETTGTISENVASDVDDLVAIGGFTIADRTTLGGRVNNAFTFEDNDDVLEVPGVDAGQAPAGLDIFPDQLTVMGWLKFTDGTNGDSAFVSKKPINWYGFYCIVDDDYFDVGLQINSSGVVNRISGTTVNPESDTWYHYAMTWDANDMRLYVDGVQDGDTYTGYDIADFPDAAGTDGYDTIVGSGWAQVRAYAGILDEIKIYKAALTPQQIQEAYEAYPPVPTYTLTVAETVGGTGASTGSGSFTAGKVTPIVAGAPAGGYVFTKWVTDPNAADLGWEPLGNALLPSTTITMPAEDITATAVYDIPSTYSKLILTNGTSDAPDEDNVAEGALVNIVADAPDVNDVFIGWIGDTQYLDEPNDVATNSLTMPGVDVTLTATYTNSLNMLKVHWPMEETSGTDVNNIASPTGWSKLTPEDAFDLATATTTGKVGNAYNFVDLNASGDADALEAKGIAAGEPAAILDIFPNEVTISGWVKATSSNDTSGTWFSKRPGGLNGLYLVAASDSFEVAQHISSYSWLSRITASFGATADTWYHYAFTWDADGMKMYIDGTQEGSTYSGFDIADFQDTDGSESYNTLVGAGWAHVNKFDGVIDEVKIWEAALSPTQIAEEYASY